ncbi:MAG: PorT family protein, partial [Hymenobacter sp.]
MKALTLSAAALLTLALAPKAHAQFGVKGGVNFAELQGRSGEDASYKTFYHVGILYQAHLIGPLSIQPEVQ